MGNDALKHSTTHQISYPIRHGLIEVHYTTLHYSTVLLYHTVPYTAAGSTGYRSQHDRCSDPETFTLYLLQDYLAVFLVKSGCGGHNSFLCVECNRPLMLCPYLLYLRCLHCLHCLHVPFVPHMLSLGLIFLSLCLGNRIVAWLLLPLSLVEKV